MKSVNFMNRPYVNVPNAATRREVMHHFVDRTLVLVSTFGLLTAIIFLLSLSYHSPDRGSQDP